MRLGFGTSTDRECNEQTVVTQVCDTVCVSGDQVATGLDTSWWSACANPIYEQNQPWDQTHVKSAPEQLVQSYRDCNRKLGNLLFSILNI